jgi:hypothetical protein
MCGLQSVPRQHSDMRGPGGLEFCLVLANTGYLLAATHGPSVLAMVKD